VINQSPLLLKFHKRWGIASLEGHLASGPLSQSDSFRRKISLRVSVPFALFAKVRAASTLKSGYLQLEPTETAIDRTSEFREEGLQTGQRDTQPETLKLSVPQELLSRRGLCTLCQPVGQTDPISRTHSGTYPDRPMLEEFWKNGAPNSSVKCRISV
jgi:hypothetical protein